MSFKAKKLFMVLKTPNKALVRTQTTLRFVCAE